MTSAASRSSPPWSLVAARATAFCWRFRTLALADRTFGSAPCPELLERRFAGRRLLVDPRRSNVQRLLYLQGEAFVGERRLLRGLLRPGMRVVDAGANIGYYLLMIEQIVGLSGKVWCFEPDAGNLVELRRNVAANDLVNVVIHGVALGAVAGRVHMAPGTNATVIPRGAGGDVEVPLATLDEMVDEVVDLVKIDVEGFEGRVLVGAERLLREHRPSLFVEIHPWLLPKEDSVDGILQRLAGIHSTVRLYELSPQPTVAAKIGARYGKRAVVPIRNLRQLLATCESGTRRHPFWAIAARQ
jgi:FkbM family methyltransferase